MKISDAQWGVLHQLKEFGPINTHAIHGPKDMSGKRKTRLETHLLTEATLTKLVDLGLVTVSYGQAFFPLDATGRKGHKRRPICIAISTVGLGLF